MITWFFSEFWHDDRISSLVLNSYGRSWSLAARDPKPRTRHGALVRPRSARVRAAVMLWTIEGKTILCRYLLRLISNRLWLLQFTVLHFFHLIFQVGFSVYLLADGISSQRTIDRTTAIQVRALQGSFVVEMVSLIMSHLCAPYDFMPCSACEM